MVVKEVVKENGVTDTIYYFTDGDDSLLGLSINGIKYYYQFNSRGDVVALTDIEGNIAARYQYDPWGKVSIVDDSTIYKAAEQNIYRYVGKYGVQYDPDTQLYLMTWRDYDPTMARFIIPDTYEGEEEEPLSKNRYMYAEGDPVNYIDPSGHWIWFAAVAYVAYRAWSAYDTYRDARIVSSSRYSKSQRATAGVGLALGVVGGKGASSIGKRAFKWGSKKITLARKANKVKKSYKVAKKGTGKVASNWKSVKQFGHTFSTHGAGSKNTKSLKGRAASTKQEQGQWLDNPRAANFLNSLGEIRGVTEVKIPKGLGQIITPSGNIVSASKVRIIPSKSGIKTAFPIS